MFVRSAADSSSLDDLPFPIAFPLLHARDERLSAGDRLENAIFVAYQAMRLTALLLLADYLDCERISRSLDDPIRGLRMPHWGDWSALADKLSQFWSYQIPDEHPERTTRFPSLVVAWMDVNRSAPVQGHDPWAQHLAGLARNGGLAISAHRAIWGLRNDRAHRMATRTVDRTDDEHTLARVLPVVERSVAALFPPGSLTLLRRYSEAPLRVMELHGAHPDLRFAPKTVGDQWIESITGQRVVALAGGVALPIYPLLVPGVDAPEACRVGSGGPIEDISLLNGIKRDRLVLLGVTSHGESKRHIGPLRAALDRKRVRPGIDSNGVSFHALAPWSRATARQTLSELRGGKYFPECYLERRHVDPVVAACVRTGGRGLLVLGESGSGKSSLLARLADTVTATGVCAGEVEAEVRTANRDGFDGRPSEVPNGSIVIFVTGRSFTGNAGKDAAALLCDVLVERAGVRPGVFATLTDFTDRIAETLGESPSSERVVWLIIDALNESPRFTDLVHALDAFLPSLEKHRWVRLVVSLRSGAYHSLNVRKLHAAEFGAAVFSNARFWHTHRDEKTGNDSPYLDLSPFGEADEGPAAYALRQARLPERSSRFLYADLSPELQSLIRSPLLLHLFHEVYRGDRRPPATLNEGALLDAFLDQVVSELPGLNGMLDDVGRMMFDGRRNSLSLEVADRWLARWRRGRQGAA